MYMHRGRNAAGIYTVDAVPGPAYLIVSAWLVWPLLGGESGRG